MYNLFLNNASETTWIHRVDFKKKLQFLSVFGENCMNVNNNEYLLSTYANTSA